MNQADLLTATFRQLASAKAGAKGALGGALHSKDGKEKAEHFREQMQKVSKDRSPVAPQIEKPADVVSATQPLLEVGALLAELTAEVKPKPVDDDRSEGEEESPRSASDARHAATTVHEWRDSNADLSVVMSRFGQAQQGPGSDDRPNAKLLAPQITVKADDTAHDPTELDSPAVETAPGKRFVASVETTDTKPAVTTKAVVREQETHFEPVQQVTTLQKIVDRMAADLPAIASPEGTHATAAQFREDEKSAESRPVRMMTLELDPPNLGSVTIKMRLAGDSVEVRLTADRLETTQLLRQERGVLADAMQSAGYSFDIAAIDHTRTPDGNMSNNQSQPQPQQQSSDPRSSTSSHGAQTDDGASGQSSGNTQGGARQNRQDHEQSSAHPERQQTATGSRVRSSTVYL